jgi:hypothetical protein
MDGFRHEGSEMSSRIVGHSSDLGVDENKGGIRTGCFGAVDKLGVHGIQFTRGK